MEVDTYDSACLFDGKFNKTKSTMSSEGHGDFGTGFATSFDYADMFAGDDEGSPKMGAKERPSLGSCFLPLDPLGTFGARAESLSWQSENRPAETPV
eukprot:CAMPEP_0206402104 /NCGR_PEP_ID=MMETSP0294-20121207/26733_1 /ASSEMBLY_ACC=CAM_ASM_000327 /TAXON_ID=39354 /ORGANISM="Heterosigma akashiwo, Strain CCMP2393" /LENGTH=96 /DNA_ID=CAMNT_0053859065 /DNA_START=45 /DNA_END=332 /DNA_ORIENTATION=-